MSEPTPTNHVKVSGGILVGYACFGLLMALFLLAFAGILVAAMEAEASDSEEEMAVEALDLVMTFAIIVSFVTSTVSLVGGIGMITGASWGKVAGYIGAGVAALSFPLGTAVAVYAFYALTRPEAHQHFGESHATA